MIRFAGLIGKMRVRESGRACRAWCEGVVEKVKGAHAGDEEEKGTI